MFLEIGPLGVIIIILLTLLLVLLASSIKIVPQANAYVVEKFGGYHATWGTGIHILIPFIFKISKNFGFLFPIIFSPINMFFDYNISIILLKINYKIIEKSFEKDF